MPSPHMSVESWRLAGHSASRLPAGSACNGGDCRIGRDAVCSLILGSPAGKVYTKLRSIGARMSETF